MEERKIREIAYYDEQAANEEGEQTNYSPVLGSQKFLYKIAAPLIAGKTVLDYGCGNGVHTKFLAEHAREVVDIDLSEGALAIARKKYKIQNTKYKIRLLKMDCEALEFPDNSFDVVFDGGTFSSLDFEKALAEITRVLKPGGVLVGIETFGHNPFANAKRVLNRITGKRTPWAASHIVRQKELGLLRQHFSQVEVYYFHFISLFAFPFLDLPGGRLALRLFEGADTLLLKIPLLQKYAFKVVFVCKNPRYDKQSRELAGKMEDKIQPSEFLALPEIWGAAKQKLPKEVWDYFAGGADTETTLRRNSEAMAHFEFCARVLRDVHNVDTTTTFLTIPLAFPVMIAPIASLTLLDPEGDLAMARAAEKMGTVHWVSTRTSHSLEEVRRAASGPLVFQLYWRGDNAWCEQLIERVEKLGFAAIALTVDAPVYSRRERDLINRFDLQALRGGVDVSMERSTKESRLTWEDVQWLRSKTTLPLIIKGIQCIEDARLAVQYGLDAIYISNHGGRQLDYAPPTIEMLNEMGGELKGKVDIVVDGGFTRGSDILKAVALGAKAVCIGKLAAWGLAAGGKRGVEKTLEILILELKNAMANTGQTRIADVDFSLVRRKCVMLENGQRLNRRPSY